MRSWMKNCKTTIESLFLFKKRKDKLFDIACDSTVTIHTMENNTPLFVFISSFLKLFCYFCTCFLFVLF